MPEPTIPERLRRLYHLHLAAAQADIAMAVAGEPGAPRMTSLRRRALAAAEEEVSAIEAAALAAGVAPGEAVVRLREVLIERLGAAARSKVVLTLAVSALKDAIAAPVALPKSQFTEQHKWARDGVKRAEADAERAIRTALELVGSAEGVA